MVRFIHSLVVIWVCSATAFAQTDSGSGQLVPEDVFAEKVFRSSTKSDAASQSELLYRILEPKSIQPGKSYPLVLFLHGMGERGDDNLAQLKHVAADFLRMREEYPAYVIFPQCPLTDRWVGADERESSGIPIFREQPSKSMSLVLQLVDSIAENSPVDLNRMYVCGLSMGGYGTWYAAAAEPKRFAAAIPVCGGGDTTWADRYSGVSLWSHHGVADPVVPVTLTRYMMIALIMTGHAPELRQTEYPGVQHDSWTQTFANDEVFHWLFSKSKSRPQ